VSERDCNWLVLQGCAREWTIAKTVVRANTFTEGSIPSLSARTPVYRTDAADWRVVQLRLMATKSVSAWRPGRRHGNRPFGKHKRVTSGLAFIQESPKLLRACRSRILERSKSRIRLSGVRR
jgi:hypothetical protein